MDHAGAAAAASGAALGSAAGSAPPVAASLGASVERERRERERLVWKAALWSGEADEESEQRPETKKKKHEKVKNKGSEIDCAE